MGHAVAALVMLIAACDLPKAKPKEQDPAGWESAEMHTRLYALEVELERLLDDLGPGWTLAAKSALLARVGKLRTQAEELRNEVNRTIAAAVGSAKGSEALDMVESHRAVRQIVDAIDELERQISVLPTE